MVLKGRSSGPEPLHLFRHLMSSSCFIAITERCKITFPGSADDLTFNKNLKFVVLYSVILYVNLEGQQKGKDELVVFIQASDGVSEHLKSQIFNDVFNSLLSFWGLFRPAKTNSQ